MGRPIVLPDRVGYIALDAMLIALSYRYNSGAFVLLLLLVYNRLVLALGFL